MMQSPPYPVPFHDQSLQRRFVRKLPQFMCNTTRGYRAHDRWDSRLDRHRPIPCRIVGNYSRVARTFSTAATRRRNAPPPACILAPIEWSPAGNTCGRVTDFALSFAWGAELLPRVGIEVPRRACYFLCHSTTMTGAIVFAGVCSLFIVRKPRM